MKGIMGGAAEGAAGEARNWHEVAPAPPQLPSGDGGDKRAHREMEAAVRAGATSALMAQLRGIAERLLAVEVEAHETKGAGGSSESGPVLLPLPRAGPHAPCKNELRPGHHLLRPRGHAQAREL